MKKSEVLVSMPMTSYEELEEYKNKYWELRGSLKECLKPSKTTGIDYVFDVDLTLEVLKKTLLVPNSSNIKITLE